MVKEKQLVGLLVLIACLLFVGGTVVAAFSEAPMLQARVASGDLPPVEERLPVPDDVYVVTPYDSVGRYGGTLRAVTLSATSQGDDILAMPFPNLVKPDDGASVFLPHIAKSMDSADGGQTWNIVLREGMRWSDGHLFTTEDLMFWYEDVLLNEDLTPVVGVKWRAHGETMVMTQVDDYNLVIEFAGPNPFFINELVHAGGWDLLFPKHYLMQFHPAYVDAAELDSMVADAGFDAWYELFANRNQTAWGVPINPDRPTLSSYVLVDSTADRRIFERNPYFWKVDPDGNQLPYIDRIEGEIISDREVMNGMIISGSVDFAGLNTSINNYPLYRTYEQDSGYNVFLRDAGKGNEVIYMVNMTHNNPALREIFQDVRFRRALSLAIDRDELNDVIYFDQAAPRQATVVDSSAYFRPEFATAYTEYDPQRAEELLDEMGLDARDSDGFRLRPDGERLFFEIEYVDIETPKTPNIELVSQYWAEIGVDVRYRAISGELASQRAPANLMDATLWHQGGMSDVLWPVRPQFTVPWTPGWERSKWPLWGDWFNTDGRTGEEPPEQIKELRGLWEEMVFEVDEDRRIELGQQINAMQAENLWVIGTIGNAPHPIIVNKRLRNVSDEDGYWVWDVIFTMSQDPSQWYFVD